MDQITRIVRDWLPSLAIIFGAGWVGFRWLFSESLRRKREMPGVDGFLAAQHARLAAHKQVVTLNATWRNRSGLPIMIDPDRTRVDVFRISDDLGAGVLDPRTTLGEPLYRHQPLAGMSSYVMEPNTESTLQMHVVLPTGSVYLFRWKLYRNMVKDDGFAWT